MFSYSISAMIVCKPYTSVVEVNGYKENSSKVDITSLNINLSYVSK